MKAPKTTKPATNNFLTTRATSRFSPRPFHASFDQQDDVSLENEAGIEGTNAIENYNMNLDAYTTLPQQSNQVVQLKRNKDSRFAYKKDSVAREAARKARYASTMGGSTRPFGNREGRLADARGQNFTETDAGTGREDRGERRIVTRRDNKGRVLGQYLTNNHYRTFRR